MSTPLDDLSEAFGIGAAWAIDGMSATFLAAFRSAAGPGTAQLSSRAWNAWRRRLLALHGITDAENRAYGAVALELNTGVRYAAYLWLTDRRLRRAVMLASAAAARSST
jgi:hypothetical protein